MNIGKFFLTLALIVIGVLVALKIIGTILGWAIATLMSVAVPAAILVAVVYVDYRLTSRKSLEGKRGILP